jgi:wyosine [tRNA(Phe)-imidazoG37] synthetase (radical SAM superfamily)
LSSKKKYIYGPVPSRRLGRSLGVDIVPEKVCTLNCIYCQLGRTTKKTIERREYAPVEPIISELKEILSKSVEADYITIAGSGEPTLNSKLGEIIDRIKKFSNIPVAVVTNGTLLYRADVRAECSKADVVMPSLDAGDERTFGKINRPYQDISIEKLISGLCKFREEYSGQIWLEVFILKGINDEDEQISKISTIIKRIRPDKIQLNTAVRPTIEKNITKMTLQELENIAVQWGQNCEVIADFPLGDETAVKSTDIKRQNISDQKQIETLFSMLKRRPCSLNDICTSLNIHKNQVLKYISDLQRKGVVGSEEIDGIVFFKALT